jgi:hypothetical protein
MMVMALMTLMHLNNLIITDVQGKAEWYVKDTFSKFKCQCTTQCVLKLNKQDLEREIERHFMLKQSERRVMCQSMLACCVARLAGAADGKDDVRRAKRAHVALEASESEEPRPQKTQFVYTLLG